MKALITVHIPIIDNRHGPFALPAPRLRPVVCRKTRGPSTAERAALAQIKLVHSQKSFRFTSRVRLAYIFRCLNFAMQTPEVPDLGSALGVIRHVVEARCAGFMRSFLKLTGWGNE